MSVFTQTKHEVLLWGSMFLLVAFVTVLLFCLFLLAGCAPKPFVMPLGADKRPCYLGVVPEESTFNARYFAPRAQEGDVLVNPSCFDLDGRLVQAVKMRRMP